MSDRFPPLHCLLGGWVLGVAVGELLGVGAALLVPVAPWQLALAGIVCGWGSVHGVFAWWAKRTERYK